MKHYLISVVLRVPPRAHFHGYLMCEDEKYVEGSCNKICKLCEEMGAKIFPAFMVTRLDAEGVETVRASAGALNPEFKECIAAATNFHISVWMMPDEDPRSEGLLALH
jgi:hypothetical protein